jgi:hypothetical protein
LSFAEEPNVYRTKIPFFSKNNFNITEWSETSTNNPSTPSEAKWSGGSYGTFAPELGTFNQGEQIDFNFQYDGNWWYGDYDGLDNIQFKDSGYVVDTYSVNYNSGNNSYNSEIDGAGNQSYVSNHHGVRFSYGSNNGSFYVIMQHTLSDIDEICMTVQKQINGASIDFNTTSSNSVLFEGVSSAQAWDPNNVLYETCLTIN